MRNAKELLNDMTELTSVEWNTKLAEEYCMNFDTFSRFVSTYEYIQVSEDNIHHKMKPLKEIDPNKPEQTLMENISGDSDEDCLQISTSMRDLGNVEFEAGDIMDQMIFCGFMFSESLVTSSLFKNCIFNNCISNNSDFTSSRIIQSKFIDCDFSDSNFDGTVFVKCVFFDCNLKNLRLSNVDFYDCLIYNCDLYDSDLDYSSFTTTLIHNCNFNNSHLRNSSWISTSVSYCNFVNTNMRDSSLYDCNLISVDYNKSHLDGVFMASSMATNVEADMMYANIFGLGDSEEYDEDFFESEDDDDE